MSRSSIVRVCLVAAVLMVVALFAMGQSAAGRGDAPQGNPFGSAARAQQEDAGTTFKVDVKLVNVFVTVQDEQGAPVSTLQRNNFELLEDGVPQNIRIFGRESELPLSIIMGIDASLSTKKDLRLELDSARRFAKSILRPIDAMALYEFSEVVDELVPFTSDLRRIDAGINRVKVGSATALYDALYLGSEALQKRQGRKVIVVITDGGDTMSSVSYQQALRAAETSEAIIYSIIIVPIENDAGRDIGGEHALIELSRETGGKHYYASSIASLDKAFQQISDELRTQYLLAYYPSRRLADSDFRRIDVKVVGVESGQKLRARHRAGYYTSKIN